MLTLCKLNYQRFSSLRLYLDFGLYRILVYSGFGLDRFIQDFGLDRFIQESGLFRVWFRQVYTGFWFGQVYTGFWFIQGLV